MTGVEILSQEVVHNSMFPNWLIGVFAIVALGCFMYLLMCNDFNLKQFLILSIIFVLSLASALIGNIKNKNSIDHIEYKVTISDEVSLTEFNEKYEILEQDGKIYTVKERTE